MWKKDQIVFVFYSFRDLFDENDFLISGYT